MVHKKLFQDLFNDKVKVPLSKFEENKIAIDEYVKRVNNWFDDLRADEITFERFKLFLENFEKQTIRLLGEVKVDLKSNILDVLVAFLKEIGEHGSYESNVEIKKTIKNIGGEKRLFGSKIESLNDYKWLKIFFVLLIFVFVLASVYFYYEGSFLGGEDVFFDDDLSSQEGSSISNENLTDDLESQENNNVSDDNNLNEQEVPDNVNDEKDNLEVVGDEFAEDDFQDEEGGYERILNSYESVVFGEINSQRVKYGRDRLNLNVNYSLMLDDNVANISAKLGIQGFIYLYDEEVSVSGEDNGYGVYDDIDKKNLFLEDYENIAISIDRKKYKIYGVKIALY